VGDAQRKGNGSRQVSSLPGVRWATLRARSDITCPHDFFLLRAAPITSLLPNPHDPDRPINQLASGDPVSLRRLARFIRRPSPSRRLPDRPFPRARRIELSAPRRVRSREEEQQRWPRPARSSWSTRLVRLFLLLVPSCSILPSLAG
jgi:hypothetical protein